MWLDPLLAFGVDESLVTAQIYDAAFATGDHPIDEELTIDGRTFRNYSHAVYGATGTYLGCLYHLKSGAAGPILGGAFAY